MNINNYDIVLVQEPYCLRNTPACLPTYCPALQGTDLYPWAISLVPNRHISVMHHIAFSNQYMITLEVLLTEIRLIVVNTYFPGDADSEEYISGLQRIVDAFRDSHILIAGDLNAHSPAWGGEVFDRRGGLLEEFFMHNDLLVINNPLSPPTFTSHRGESWIDVTVGCSRTYTKINNWRVLSEDSLTEHALISFDLFNSVDGQTPAYAPPLKYALNRADWLGLKDYLETHLISYYSESPIDARQQIDTNIASITHACDLYIPKKTPRKRRVPWWTNELENLRRTTRHLRRTYQRCRDNRMRNMHRTAYLLA
ncbi:uncharacterized protein LOC111631977 [Centruroides sculpturatus]|uniref:uncharacterized protein LOC111631977 n=1 Tax=Centruroides sculpturatus TaxID=218467 RepID=UPI000C6DE2BD|nr:uncharacterized protein LOC111631977 [Centruroides sculpturatus]